MKIILLICLFPLFVFGGGAINFDGVDDYVSKSNPSFINDQQGTFSAWIKRDNVVGNWAFGSVSTDGVTGDECFFYSRDTEMAIVYLLHGGIQVYAYDPSITADTNWHHVIFLSNGTKIKLYFDGEEKTLILTRGSNTGQWLGDVIDADIFSIGSIKRASPMSSFEGSIGEVLIYNKALSPEEIKRIYTSKNVWYPKNGLVSRWTMENNGVSTGQSHANGSIIKDSAGSNDGTIVDGSDSSMILKSSPTRTKRGRR